MRGPRLLFLVVAIALSLSLAFVRSTFADEETFKVIVHPDNTNDTVSRDFLRDIYLRKTADWGGKTVRPIDLSSKHPERDQFRAQVIRKSASQLRTYWNQQVFSGKGVPPPEASSPTDVIRYVLAHPGAVGYIPAGVDPGKAKVIKVQ